MGVLQLASEVKQNSHQKPEKQRVKPLISQGYDGSQEHPATYNSPSC